MLTLRSPKLNLLLQEFYDALKSLYGDRLIHVILFGSQARDEATEDSDIDVLIVLQDPISAGDEIFRMSTLRTELNLKYDECISVMPVSLSDYQMRSTPFLENVRREGIIL